MSSTTPLHQAGRPRGFEPEAALRAALAVFWRQGYRATSVEDLTTAMGIRRSSFYACFATKHALLMQSVAHYADHVFADLQAIAASGLDHDAAIAAILDRVAEPAGGVQGCLFISMISELAPDDAELAAYGRFHIGRVADLVTSILIAARIPPAEAATRAGALLACAVGAIMLRKAGLPPGQIAALLAATGPLRAPANHPTAP